MGGGGHSGLQTSLRARASHLEPTTRPSVFQHVAFVCWSEDVRSDPSGSSEDTMDARTFTTPPNSPKRLCLPSSPRCSHLGGASARSSDGTCCSTKRQCSTFSFSFSLHQFPPGSLTFTVTFLAVKRSRARPPPTDLESEQMVFPTSSRPANGCGSRAAAATTRPPVVGVTERGIIAVMYNYNFRTGSFERSDRCRNYEEGWGGA